MISNKIVFEKAFIDEFKKIYNKFENYSIIKKTLSIEIQKEKNKGLEEKNE